MQRSRFIIFIVIITLLVVVLIIRRTSLQTPSETRGRHVFPNSSQPPKSSKMISQEKVYDDPWEEWIDKQTEIVVKEFLENKPEWYNTKQERDQLWKNIHAQTIEIAAAHKKVLDIPPGLSENGTITTVEAPLLIHNGPQTTEAIMERFDKWYSDNYPGAVTVDEKYPRAEWIDLILGKGFNIENHLDYTRLLSARYWLAHVEDKPDVWESGKQAIPATNNFEIYKDAYIERKIWEAQQLKLAEQADPDVNGGFFIDSHPDVFLPSKRNRVYVHRDEDAMKTWGQTLSVKQRFDLTYRGIHPEGWEIIYLDKDFKVVDEKPAHITRDMVRTDIPPGNWIPPEGWEPPPGFEEALRERGWAGSLSPQDDSAEHTTSEEFSRRAAEATRTAKKQLQHTQKEILELMNKSDAEIETEIEKLLTPKLSEAPTDKSIESMFREQFDIERFSSERLNRSMEILNRYGPEEGLRRLRKDDPEIADQVELLINRKPPPRNQETPVQ